MNPLKKLAGETVIYGIPTIIGRFINWLLVPLYTQIFPNEEYGVVVNLMAYTAMFMVILTYGMETGYFRFASREDKSKVFSTIIISLSITTLIFLLLVFTFIDKINLFLDNGANLNFIVLIALTLGIDAISSIPFAKLRLDSRPVRFAIIKTINICCNVLFNILFLLVFPWIEEKFKISIPFFYSDYGIGYIFLSYLLTSLITLILLLPEFFKIEFYFSRSLLKRILNYSFPILIVGIAAMVNINLDKILLPKLLNSDNAVALTGIYGANYKLALVMYIVVQAFKFAFEPFFFSKYKNEDSNDIYIKVLNYFIGLGLLIFLVIMFYIDKLKFFIDSSYHEGVIIVPLVLMANLFQGIFYSLSLWYKLSDKTSLGAYIAVIGSFITIVLNIVLVPRIGYMGSAYAVFFCFFIMVILSYLLGQKYYKIDYDLKKIGIYFFTAFSLYYISKYIIMNNIWLQMLVKTPLLVVFVLVFIYKERLLLFKNLK